MPKGAPAVEMTVAADGYWKRREHDGECPYLMLCEYRCGETGGRARL